MQDRKPLDVGDETSVGKRKTKVQLRIENEREEMRQLLEKKWGRNILWRLLEQTGVYKPSFTGNSETFFKEGRRSVGLAILDMIFDADIKAYGLMQEENRKTNDSTDE